MREFDARWVRSGVGYFHIGKIMTSMPRLLVLYFLTFIVFSNCKNRNELTSEEKVLNGEPAPDWETDVYQIPGGTGLLVPDIDGGPKSRLIATARHVSKKGPIKSKDDGRILEVADTISAPAVGDDLNPDLKIIVLKECVATKKKITLKQFDDNFLIGKLATGYGYGSDSADANEILRLTERLNQGPLRLIKMEKIINSSEKYDAFMSISEGPQSTAWCPGDSGGPVVISTQHDNYWVGSLVAYRYTAYITGVCVADAGSTKFPVTSFILTQEFFRGLTTALGLADSNVIRLNLNTTYASASDSCELLNPNSKSDVLAEKIVVSILKNLPFYFEDRELVEKNATETLRADYKLWPERKKNAILFVKNYFEKFSSTIGGINWKLPSKEDLPAVRKQLRSIYTPQPIPESLILWLRSETSKVGIKSFTVYLGLSETVRTISSIDADTSLSACFRTYANAVIPTSGYFGWINGLREKYSCR